MIDNDVWILAALAVAAETQTDPVAARAAFDRLAGLVEEEGRAVTGGSEEEEKPPE